jgi:acetoin utilization protein AcuB
MLVRNWMNKNVITIGTNESLLDALKLLKQNNIGTLPVMEKDKLVGIVTDRDVKRASVSDAVPMEIHELLYFLSKLGIEEIMTKNPITVPPDFTIEEVEQVLLENKISSVPVVDNRGQVVGIITQNDLFKVIVSLTGFNKRGIQFAFELEDRPGSIEEMTDILREYGGRIASILSSIE